MLSASHSLFPNTVEKLLLITPSAVALSITSPFSRRRHYRGYTITVSSAVTELGEVRSPELVAREYADLNLSDKFCEEVGHVRIRQHVNPLRSSLMIPAEVPDWNEVYEDAKLPLMVDIGSGSGRFLLWLAKRNSGFRNYLGLEIRPKLVTRANFWANELTMRNVHFMFANATISFKQLVLTYPGPLMLVSILCPDPHFKKKHHKRRVVQQPLVESIVDSLTPGGRIFLQSDILQVAVDMRNYFDAKLDELVHVDSIDNNMPCNTDGWLLNNPLGIRTEREIHAEFEGARIYRRMYQKRRIAMSTLTNVHDHVIFTGLRFARFISRLSVAICEASFLLQGHQKLLFHGMTRKYL